MHTNNLLGLLTAPTRVGSGVLLGGVIVLLLLASIAKAPRAQFLRCHAFAYDCIEQFEKLRLLLGSARRRSLRCLLCYLLVFVERFDLCFDKFRDWFLLVYHRFMRVLKKSNAAKPPNERR